MNKSKLLFLSLAHSLGVLVYITLVALLMSNADKVFGNSAEIVGPIVFLLLFVLSATIVGLLVLGKPAMMYHGGDKSDAVKFLFLEIGWMALIVSIFFIILAWT